MTKVEKKPKQPLNKEQKRAQALRDNLKKRKTQANLRKEILEVKPLNEIAPEKTPKNTK